MDYRFLIDTAIDLIKKRYTNSTPPVVGDTVCVIYAGNGKIYTGINTYVVSGNLQNNIHAEIDAVNKMRSEGESKIIAMTVFNSCNISPILPCNSCINMILTLSFENTGTLVVTHNGAINITDIGRYVSTPSNNAYQMPGNSMAGNNYSIYHNIPETNRGSSLYINPNARNESIGYVNNMNMPNQSTFVQPMTNSVTMQTAPPPKTPGGSSLLKNKLNNLLGDD